jgi:uncharacterized membrane protein YoaK (UPF0700 family)
MAVTNISHQNLSHSIQNETTSPFHTSPPQTQPKRLMRLRTNTDADTPPVAQVPLPERKKHHFIAISIGGTLLTINAGFINAVTALHSGMFTTHVTGTFTRAGISIEQLDGGMFVEYIMLIICFMFGSFLCSLLVPYQTFYLGRAYNLVFMLGTVFLLLASLLGVLLPQSHVFTFFVAIASGMQNAMTTGYSGSVLRTTHMTGMTTDVGIIFAKLAKGERKDVWKLAMFLPMMTGFLIGGALGAKAVSDLGVFALFMNVVLFAGTGLLYVFYLSLKHHISFFTALFHNTDLMPRKKGHVIPKDLNIDETLEMGNREVVEAFQPVASGEFGDGFDIDDEFDEADITTHDLPLGEDKQYECEVIEEGRGEDEELDEDGEGKTPLGEFHELELEDSDEIGQGPVNGSYERV